MTVDFHIRPGGGEVQKVLAPSEHKIKRANPE